jgi:hypothetical protein
MERSMIGHPLRVFQLTFNPFLGPRTLKVKHRTSVSMTEKMSTFPWSSPVRKRTRPNFMFVSYFLNKYILIEFLYFLCSSGQYRFDTEDNKKCAAIGTMMKIGEKAAYLNMGGCPEALEGCEDGPPPECDEYVSSVWTMKDFVSAT